MKLDKRLAFLPCLVWLAACDIEDMNFGGMDMNRFKKDFQYNYTLKPGGTLTIENRNGSIEIAGWEKDSVEIVGTKYASTQQLLDSVQIDIVNEPNAVRIRTVTPSTVRGNLGARYVLHVPNRLTLDRIVSSNGSVRIENVEGPARVRTSNGSVKINHLQGALEVQTSNGAIETHDFKGGATLRTSNGSINADEIRGAFEATTTNGRISARIVDPEPRQTIRAESSNGSVDLTIANLHENPINVHTSNSSITLKLPPTTNANLNASTSNGGVSTEFDLEARGGRISKHSMNGNLGSGGVPITLSTSNGAIRVQKM